MNFSLTKKGGLRVATALLFATTATACTSPVANWVEVYPTPKELNVQVTEDRLAVQASANSGLLMQGEAQRIRDFLAQQGDMSDLRVTVYRTARGSKKAAAGVAHAVAGAGVPKSNISHGDGWSGAEGAVEIVATRYDAGITCPDWRRPMIGDNSNVTSSNWGCANASNLAAMVADPKDLVVGRDEDPASGKREADAVQRYNDGKVKKLLKQNVFSLSSSSE